MGADMKTIILSAFLLIGGLARWMPTADAQAPSQSENAAMKVQIVEGMLSNYDGKQRIMWIKIADSSQMEFSYTAETPLVGASRQLEIGDHLKVSYESAGGVNNAVKVELMPAQS